MQQVNVARKKVVDFSIKRVLSLWPYMLVSGFILLGVAWLYLRYTPNIYEASTTVILENEANLPVGEALFSKKDPFQNQVALLKSPTVAKRVVDKFRLQYHAELKGRVKNTELFSEFKWWVNTPSSKKEKLSFELEVQKDGFSWRSGEAEGKGKWGAAVIIHGNEVRTEQNGRLSQGDVIYCYESDAWSEAERISAYLAATTTEESNVITMSYWDNVPERTAAVLDEVLVSYNEVAKLLKSKSYQQSYQFIQERLDPISYELDSIETQMAAYKARKGYIGMSTKGEIFMQQSTAYEERLKEVQVQKNILNAAEKYLSDPGTRDVNMAVTGINDPTLSASITQFHQLRADRERLAQSLTENNPRLQQADIRLQDARNNIDVQLGNYRDNIKILENSLVSNMSQAQGMIRSTPKDEKTLLEQSRMQAIKQELFLLLLQKREEAAINLAGVSVQSPVISPARIPTTPVSPKRGQILIGSFLIGLILPVGFASIREIMNNKVTSKMQLEQMTSVPVIAEVDEIKKSGEVMVSAGDRSIFGEQVRTLRTKLNFYSSGKKPFYIMMTSSMSGEGKSFLASNLAASFALSGKKTALLEFDLRKPRLSENFGIKKGKGIVNVLMGEEDPWNIREKVMPDHLLFLYSSGPVPPNPSELMEMEGMRKLKKYLDENYDVVIIDSAPYALVTDAHLLESWSDVSLFVVRFNQTEMEQIHELEEAKQKRLFKNMAIVFNGISTSGYYGYRGGYYHTKRKYGRAYTTSDKRKA